MGRNHPTMIALRDLRAESESAYAVARATRADADHARHRAAVAAYNAALAAIRAAEVSR